MNIFRRRPIPPIEHLPGEVEAEHDAFLRIANYPELEGLGQKAINWRATEQATLTR